MDGWQHLAEGGDANEPDQVVAPAPNVFDQFDQGAKPAAPAPAVTPAPPNFFDRFDAPKPAPAAGGNFFDQFDSGKPATAPRPAYTRESPLVPKAQGDIEAAPPGSWLKDPARGDLYQMPAKAEPAAPPPPPLDFTKLTPAVRDTGIFAAPFAGIMGAGHQLKQSAEAITGTTPKESTPDQPELLAAQPVEWGDLLHPGTLAEKALYQLGESAPTIAGGIAGAVGGGALGAAVPIGGETGLTEAGGALAGGALGAAAASSIQAIGPNFSAAMKAHPGDPDAAWSTAIKQTAAQGGITAVGWAAFGIAPFESTIKNMVFQAFGVQPAVSAAGRAAQNVAEGKPVGQGVAETIPGAVIGTVVPLAGHAIATRLMGHAAAPAATAPAAGQAGPEGAAPPGAGVPASGAGGAGPAAPGGDIVLKDAEGTEHPMTPEDVARLRAPLPTGEPNAPTQEAAGAPPAAEAGATEGAARPAVPSAPTEAARPEPAIGYEMAGEGVPATMEDLEHVAALERAAAAGTPVTPQPALATAEATLGREAQGLPAEPSQAPAVVSQPEQPTPVVSQEPSLVAPPVAAAAPQATEIAPPETTKTEKNIPANIPGPVDPYQRAVELLQSRGVGNPINAGVLRSQLGLSLPDTRSLIDRLSTEGYLTGAGRNMTIAEPGTRTGEGLAAPAVSARTEPEPKGQPLAAPAALSERPIQETGTESATEPERAPLQYRAVRDQPESAFIPATGAAIPVSHVIADVHDLVTSHNDDLSPNPAYPQALQPRNRERAETEAQIASILNGGREGAFRPELLGETPDAANGAPIVGPEGYVEGGNARTMALRRAYERGLPQAEQYRSYLAAQGYPIEGIVNPVLVRLDRSGADMPQREQLARDLNVPPQAAMSATEQAMADARQIPSDLLRSYVGGDVFSGQNKPFWGGILRAVSHPGELPALTDPSGDLSRAGRARVQNALLAKAYGDSGIVSSLAEDADSNIKAIGSALTDAAPTWAQLREAATQGRVPQDYDLTSPLLEAVRLIQHARESGRNIAEFVNQRDMLAGGLSPETESVLSWMLGAPDWTRRYGREKIADALKEYAESAQRQPGMLGQARPAPLELTEQARERAQGASRDLFAAPVVEPGGAEALRARAGENGTEASRPQNDPARAAAPETGAEGAGDRQGGLGLAEDIAAPPFFSALTRAVEAIPQPKAPGAQWANLIRNLTNKGVKQDEIDWSGVLDWLKEHPGVVTKDQLLDELRANEVHVEEVQRGAPTEAPDVAAKRERFQRLQDKLARTNRDLSPEEDAEARELLADLQGIPNPWLDSDKEAKFAGYNLPGGNNYREMLLTLPSADAEGLDAAAQRMFAKPYRDLGGDQRARVQNETRNAFDQRTYRGPHWPERNVLAHVRMDDRTDAEGRKVLHVAEIQSDWHQQGRRQGYQPRDAGALEARRREIEALGREATPEQKQEWADIMNRLRPDDRDVEGASKYRGVPNAPLKTQWPELAMKRVLRYAAEHGYDRVSWDTGATQADRYDLSKHVDRISYAKDGDGTWSFSARKDAERPGDEWREVLGRKKQTPEQISEALGKDIADKITGGVGHEAGAPAGSGELRGLDLKVGGEGMRGFYDRILPAFVNKYAKKWGARVDPATIHTDLDRFNYEGPSPQDDRARADIGREAIGRSVSLGRQWVAVERAVREGMPFADAMRENGSAELADIVGGKMVERPDTAPVHAVDITPQMREGVMRGQPLWERRAIGSAEETPFRNTRADWDAYRANTAFPNTPEANQMAAREYVRQRGTETGNEHIAVYDPQWGGITHVGTSDRPDRVSFATPGLDERLADPKANLVIHHNHPGDRAASVTDIAALGHPGVGAIVAHAHGPDVFAATLSPEAKAGFDQHLDRPGNLAASRAPYDAANRIVRSALTMQVFGDKLAPEAAERLQADMVNRALDAAGFANYVSTRGSEGLPDQVYRSIIARAAREAQDAMAQSPRTAALRGDVRARLDRSTVVLQPDAAMAEISRLAAGAERGPAGAGAAERGAERVGAASGRDEAVVGAGLREEPVDFGTGAVDEAVDEAGTPEDTRGYFQRLGNSLGIGAPAPGRGDHFFNILNKDFTFPRSKASLDPRSSQKWQAELAKKREATALVGGYHDGLASWTGKPPETWRKVFAAMEILTLEGRQVPLDGRAVIAENSRFPFAAHSKMGDTIRLTTPDEIGMFTDYRRTMDKVWKDLVGETAKQFGWEGEPSSAAIYKAAENAGGDTREGKRLRRAAQLVAAIEYQHRNAYLPLMRQGDYFLRVKPKEGTEDKPGIPGWTEGFPPTVMYKLLDSMTPFERAVGGQRSGIPKTAQAEMDRLRQDFPAGEYDIDHGYAFRSADALRDLDIPTIDKLMMLVSNDVRGQMEDRFTHSGFSKSEAHEAAQGDYDKLVDTVLDKLYEERVAGFKRQRLGTPGYSPDFARSTGQYTNWLANHISTMRHQADIDSADEAIAKHPDPQTRAFWRDRDRQQEDYGNQLNGPLMRLRQGAFYWMLGANAATTAKIMLHGPLRGVPILTTGLGAAGRARAAATYLGASKDILKGFRVGRSGLEIDVSAGARDAAERALVADAEKQGIIHPQTAEEMAAVRRQGEEALSPRARGMRRFLDIWSSNVSAADRLTRGAMLLAGYRTAKTAGMDTINRAWDRDLNWRDNPERTPEGFAKFLVDQTVGIWGDINRMPFMRSQLGGMLGQFRLYEVGYLSNLHQMMTRMGPEGKVTAALMLGGLGMMGGLVALPFAKDAMQAGQWAYGAITGTTPDWQDDLREAFDWLIPGAGSTVMHGSRPLGIDWSGIGFGDIIGRNAQSPLDFLGAAGSMAVGAPNRAIERERSGQSDLAAFAELTPNAVKHMLQALYPEISLYSASGATKIAQAPTDADRVRTGLGFQLGSRAEHFQQTGEAARRGDAYRTALATAENRIANLHDRGEPIQDALSTAEGLIQDGERRGVFSPQEVSAFRRQLRQKFQQRANPTLGSPTMRRMQALQPAQP